VQSLMHQPLILEPKLLREGSLLVTFGARVEARFDVAQTWTDSFVVYKRDPFADLCQLLATQGQACSICCIDGTTSIADSCCFENGPDNLI